MIAYTVASVSKSILKNPCLTAVNFKSKSKFKLELVVMEDGI